MPGFMRLFALSMYGLCGLSIVLGVVVFIRNVIRRGDLEYEARFPWRVRLSLYLAVLVIPPFGWINGEWLNAPWWVHLLLYSVAFAIPLVGLLGSLWLRVFRKTRERVKLAKGLIFVSLAPIVFLIGTSVDPATSVAKLQIGGWLIQARFGLSGAVSPGEQQFPFPHSHLEFLSYSLNIP
jgi:hypothetical protein